MEGCDCFLSLCNSHGRKAWSFSVWRAPSPFPHFCFRSKVAVPWFRGDCLRLWEMTLRQVTASLQFIFSLLRPGPCLACSFPCALCLLIYSKVKKKILQDNLYFNSSQCFKLREELSSSNNFKFWSLGRGTRCLEPIGISWNLLKSGELCQHTSANWLGKS